MLTCLHFPTMPPHPPAHSPSLLPVCSQALSKRIHYGMFVAEAKFRKQTDEYTQLIQRQDGAAILELLTDRAVELKVGGFMGGWGWLVRRACCCWGRCFAASSRHGGTGCSQRCF